MAAEAPSLVVTNGCGSGWNTWLVPDSIPVLKCNFLDACNRHDVCYGRCEGRQSDKDAPECEYLKCLEDELFKTFNCGSDVRLMKLITAADVRKKTCDDTLYRNIRDLNPGVKACAAFALVYRHAVKKWGKGAFRGVDPTGKMLDQPKPEYDAAIREFFRLGTEEQFAELVKSYDEGSRPVDLGKPISFDGSRGLHNKPK